MVITREICNTVFYNKRKFVELGSWSPSWSQQVIMRTATLLLIRYNFKHMTKATRSRAAGGSGFIITLHPLRLSPSGTKFQHPLPFNHHGRAAFSFPSILTVSRIIILTDNGVRGQQVSHHYTRINKISDQETEPIMFLAGGGWLRGCCGVAYVYINVMIHFSDEVFES